MQELHQLWFERWRNTPSLSAGQRAEMLPETLKAREMTYEQFVANSPWHPAYVAPVDPQNTDTCTQLQNAIN